MIKKIALSSLLSLSAVHADTLRPLLGVGYDFGGTTLATVEHYDYYDGYDKNKIRAGQGISFEAGMAMGEEKGNIELQLTVGYKLDSDSADNGEVTWDLIPFSALALFKKDKWKFGGGITYHLNPHLSGSFTGYDNNGQYFNDSANDRYENALGGVVKIQYRANEAVDIGIKGTFIEYKLKADPKIISRGNSVGIILTYTFGNKRYQYR